MYKCENCNNTFTRFNKKDVFGYYEEIPCCPHCKTPLDTPHIFYIQKNEKWVRL